MPADNPTCGMTSRTFFLAAVAASCTVLASCAPDPVPTNYAELQRAHGGEPTASEWWNSGAEFPLWISPTSVGVWEGEALVDARAEIFDQPSSFIDIMLYRDDAGDVHVVLNHPVRLPVRPVPGGIPITLSVPPCAKYEKIGMAESCASFPVQEAVPDYAVQRTVEGNP